MRQRFARIILCVGLLFIMPPLIATRAQSGNLGCMNIGWDGFYERFDLNSGDFRIPPIVKYFDGLDTGIGTDYGLQPSPDGRYAALMVPERFSKNDFWQRRTVALVIAPFESKGDQNPVVIQEGSPRGEALGGGDSGEFYLDSALQFQWLKDSQRLFYMWPETINGGASQITYYVGLTDPQGRRLGRALLQTLENYDERRNVRSLHPDFISTSGDGNYILIRMYTPNYLNHYQIWDMHTLKQVLAFETAFGDGYSPEFAWFGSQIAYLAPPNPNASLVLFDVRTRRKREFVLNQPDASLVALKESIIVEMEDHLDVIGVNTGTIAHFNVPLSAGAFTQVSPNQRYVLVISGNQASIIDLMTNRVARYLWTAGAPYGMVWSPDDHFVALFNKAMLRVLGTDSPSSALLSDAPVFGSSGDAPHILDFLVFWRPRSNILIFTGVNDVDFTYQTWSYHADTQTRRLIVENAPQWWYDKTFLLSAANLAPNEPYLITQWADSSGEHSGSVNLDTGRRVVLLDQAPTDEGFFTIYYTRMVTISGKTLLWMNFDGTEPFRLNVGAPFRVLPEAWWGSKTWFIQTAKGELYGIDPTTADYWRVLEKLSGDPHLIFAPDQRSMVVTDSSAGTLAIYLVPEQRSTPILMSKYVWDLTHPDLRWSPDSERFFIASGIESRTLDIYSRTGTLLKHFEGLPAQYGYYWATCTNR